MDRSCRDMTVLLIVCHLWHQVFIAVDESIGEIRTKLSLEVCGQRMGPAELRFKRARSLPNDFLGPFWLEEPRAFGTSEKPVTEGKVGEHARVKDDQRTRIHSGPGSRTFS